MDLKIFSAINEILAKNPDRFFTPGHKGVLSAIDITEIDDSFPGESVEQAQAKIAGYYGSENLRFLCGGSSIGIKAAIMSVGGDVIISANSHISVYEGAKLAGVRAIAIDCAIKDGLPAPLDADRIRYAIAKYPQAKAVCLLSPDYYGRTISREAATAVKEAGKLLLIDGAHGAHFAFRPDLFPETFTDIADAINFSAHKTLPAYTQTAYLCVKDTLINKVDENLKLLGTTSPSYLFYSGLEYAAEYAKEFALYYDMLKTFREGLEEKVPLLNNDDITRVCADAQAMGMTGEQLYAKMKAGGIIPEMYDDRYVVFILTLLDDRAKLIRLKEGLCKASL